MPVSPPSMHSPPEALSLSPLESTPPIPIEESQSTISSSVPPKNFGLIKQFFKNNFTKILGWITNFYQTYFNRPHPKPMRIDQIAEVDFSTHWIVCNPYGEISALPKDPLAIRWIKTAVWIFTLFTVDPYGHVRIDRVADFLFKHFKKETYPQAKDMYLKVINQLLDRKTTLIRRDRTILMNLKKKLN